MATQRLTREQISSEEFAATRDFLARFGIAPGQLDQYDRIAEDDVLRAIRARGWEPTIEQEEDPPGWKAEIQEWRTVSQFRSAVAHDRDRMMALLRALRTALAWPTRDEEFQAFDEQTRSLMGLSATDFLKQWDANELSVDDPRVVHLLIARPLGW
jgi:hypothetical protein